MSREPASVRSPAAEHPETRTDPLTPSKAWPDYVLVGAVAFVIVFWRLGLPPLDGHEAFVAVTARNMTHPDSWLDPMTVPQPIPPNTTLNHWMVPVFNGQPRLVKTPLAYWCVAVLGNAGAAISPFVVRVPSAIAAVGLVLLTLALGRRLLSRRAALMGGLMLATSVGLYQWGRNARPDMQACLWMAAAMAAFYLGINARTARTRAAWLLAGWLALGLGNLAKEFVPLILGLPILIYLCWRASAAVAPSERETRRWLVDYVWQSALAIVVSYLVQIVPVLHWWSYLGLSAALGNGATMALALGIPLGGYFLRSRAWRQVTPLLPTALPGVAIMLLLFVPWVVYMAWLFPQTDSILTQQTVGRAVGSGAWTVGSVGPLSGYYILALLKQTAPWVLFLPAGVATVFLARFRDRRDSLVYLFAWLFGVWLVFTVFVGKREHYVLPALPAACLLTGYFAEDVFFAHRWAGLRSARALAMAQVGLVILAMAAASVAAFLLPLFTWSRVAHTGVMILLLTPFLIYVLRVVRKGRPEAALPALLALAAVGYLATSTRADLWNKNQRLSTFAQQAAAAVPAQDTVAAWSSVAELIVYHFQQDIPSADVYRRRLVRDLGPQAGNQQWQQWLTDRSRPFWMFARRDEIPRLLQLGFVPRMEMIGDKPQNDDPILLYRPPL